MTSKMSRNRTHSQWVDMFLQRSQTVETLALKREMSKSGSNFGVVAAGSRTNASVGAENNLSGPETPSRNKINNVQAQKFESSINHLTDSQLELLLEHVLLIKEEERARHQSVRSNIL